MSSHFEKQVQNALAVIKELQLEEFIKNFDGNDGFMWSSDARVKEIGEKLEGDGHSGASFAITLRKCQHILRQPNGDGVEVVGEKIYNKMDDNNKKAADIMATEGMDKAVRHMFLHPQTGEPMDYATMRSFYG
jgi:hypothetical protein